MMPDYSYFRAEGLSLQAIEASAEAKAEVKQLKEKLLRKFGATSLSGGIDSRTKRYTVSEFTFQPPQTPPPGWVDAGVIGGSGTTTRWELPAPGSPDHFYVVNTAGLMERAASRSSLGVALGAAEMPSREVPEGIWNSRFFVTWSSLKDPPARPPKAAGTIPIGNFFDGAMSGGKVYKPDPIRAMPLGDAWYIRVPNHPGKSMPLFTPPDAVPVSYDDMLAADAVEQQKHSGPVRPTGFIPNCS